VLGGAVGPGLAVRGGGVRGGTGVISAAPGEAPAVRFAASAESAGLDSSGPADMALSALTAGVAPPRL
jgi:hypothetical protein